MFSVVKSVEGKYKKITITAVPSQWIINKSILLWPPGSKIEVSSMIKNKKKATDTWSKIPCQIKMADINTLAQANRIAEMYANLSDTESEERHFCDNEIYVDLNDMIHQVNNSASQPTFANQPTSGSPHNFASQPTSGSQHNFASQPTSASPYNTSYQEFQNKVDHELAKINVKLDKLLLQSNKNSCIPTRCDKITDIILPLTSHEEMVSLELKLSDQEVQEQLIEKLSEMGGKSGKQNGSKIAFKLSLAMFDVELLPQYSWTGTSRNKNGDKQSFLKLENISKVFFEVVKNADKTFSKLDTEMFFKMKALKHSNLRLNRKLDKN